MQRFSEAQEAATERAENDFYALVERYSEVEVLRAESPERFVSENEIAPETFPEVEVEDLNWWADQERDHMRERLAGW